MSPNRVEKEVRLQGGVRGEPALVSPSSFFLPHLSPWPSPGIAQSCGHCKMPGLFAKRAEVAPKVGNRPHAQDRQGTRRVGQGKVRCFSSTQPQGVRAHTVGKLSPKSEKRGRPHKSCVWTPSILA